MSQNVTIYHNPRCSKSRQTLELLQTRGLAPDVIHYLETPPDAQTLEALLSLLTMEPRDLMRQQEEIYTTLHLAQPDLTRAQLIQAMVDHPQLIERPIVIINGKAVIARPPENVLSIL
ncbi:arsenate reductase (glutaredoxin) [Thiolinea disciformis]|uniref:arsenate reductase (glutaredoxin) n=1 Tax=Thiolinea disciformis TaxID=125614 RepID=UPI0003730DEB|nr:arsenate reductase (glutaredoxin) [Thiolinea disciformis]